MYIERCGDDAGLVRVKSFQFCVLRHSNGDENFSEIIHEATL